MLKEMLKKIKPETYDEPSMGSPEAYYPSFCLSSDNLPEVKDWDIDKDYYLVMKVTSKSKSMMTKGKKEVYESSFDIKEVGVKEIEEKKEDNSLKQMYD